MKTLFDRIWDAHVVEELGDGEALLHVDRNMLHDLAGSMALSEVTERGLPIHSPSLSFATPDHAIGTEPVPGRRSKPVDIPDGLVRMLRRLAPQQNIQLFDDGSPGQGIIHVMGPALGLTLPGLTVVCGDSHTCTHGALGALGWGIGSTDVGHVLATSTIAVVKPRQIRLTLNGKLRAGVAVKDVALALIRRFGPGAGAGHAIEYAGPAVAALEVEERMTLVNMAVELGARFGLMAPDERVFAYLEGRPYAPSGETWLKAKVAWSELRTDDHARFDRELEFDVGDVAPQITWGTGLGQTIDLNEKVPSPAAFASPQERESAAAALDYMGLQPGQPIAGTPVDWVFIGSCTNGRLSDLRRAAAVVEGRRVASTVRAWVVPGSTAIKLQAEKEGLAALFMAAGFEWRESGCSLCCAANGETVQPGSRTVSTSNRNFMGRQGPGVRTHIASPEVAAASALAGAISAP